jgi:hypothetical protein
LLFVPDDARHFDEMAVLYETKLAPLELDEARGLVRYTRSAEPFANIDEATTMFRGIVSSSATIDRREPVLLSDVRLAHGRNDDAFESAVASFRNELFRGFRKRAALVRTMAGKLQVRRMNGTMETSVDVFDDEAAALAFLAAR